MVDNSKHQNNIIVLEGDCDDGIGDHGAEELARALAGGGLHGDVGGQRRVRPDRPHDEQQAAVAAVEVVAGKAPERHLHVHGKRLDENLEPHLAGGAIGEQCSLGDKREPRGVQLPRASSGKSAR